MANTTGKNKWWIATLLVGFLGVVEMVVVDRWIPSLEIIGLMVFLGLLGACFIWGYLVDREKYWWSIIPGLALLVILVAGLVDTLLSKITTDDWINVLVLGAGAALIAWVLKRRDARTTLIIVAVITIMVGILMAPLPLLWMGILVAANFLVGGYFLWRTRRISG